MDRPTTSPCEPDENEPYAPSCPAETRGCSLKGPTRISLIDTKAHHVLNTIIVLDPLDGQDSLEIPYVVRRGGPYFVPGRKEYGKPIVLRLRDFNGDGRAYEFALFDALNCSDLFVAVFGYSLKQDRIINYVFRLRDVEEAGTSFDDCDWIEGFAWQKPLPPVRQYHWNWSVVHPPGVEEEYEVTYRPDLEVFEGTVAHRDWVPKNDQ